MNMETMKSELDNVQYVSIDMYDTYRDVASIFFPKAKCIFSPSGYSR